MRAAALVALAALSALSCPAWGQLGGLPDPDSDLASLRAALGKDPYSYNTRRRLVQTFAKRGDHLSAYYHAAWLAWLAPQRYAESEAGWKLLRDRRARDRAAASQTPGPTALVIAAVDADRLLARTCLDGAISQQASRLRAEITDLIAQAEQTEAALGQIANLPQSRPDPLSRLALARLYLTLDDSLRLEHAHDSQRARTQALRKAASLASAVALWLPKSPGAHRTLAIAWARLAQLGERSDLWELAIYECETAQALDPADQTLTEMVWTLHLRAGHWPEASRWQTGGPPGPGRAGMSPRGRKPARAGRGNPPRPQ